MCTARASTHRHVAAHRANRSSQRAPPWHTRPRARAFLQRVFACVRALGLCMHVHVACGCTFSPATRLLACSFPSHSVFMTAVFSWATRMGHYRPGIHATIPASCPGRSVASKHRPCVRVRVCVCACACVRVWKREKGREGWGKKENTKRK